MKVIATVAPPPSPTPPHPAPQMELIEAVSTPSVPRGAETHRPVGIQQYWGPSYLERVILFYHRVFTSPPSPDTDGFQLIHCTLLLV